VKGLMPARKRGGFRTIVWNPSLCSASRPKKEKSIHRLTAILTQQIQYQTNNMRRLTQERNSRASTTHTQPCTGVSAALELFLTSQFVPIWAVLHLPWRWEKERLGRRPRKANDINLEKTADATGLGPIPWPKSTYTKRDLDSHCASCRFVAFPI
jgi:hypothetical protein